MAYSLNARLKLLGSVAVAMTMLAGCDGAKHKEAPPSLSEPVIHYQTDLQKAALVPPDAHALSIHLPFDKYTISVDQLYTIEGAQDVAIRSCMKAKGVSWPSIDRPKLGDWRNRRRYGVIELKVAKTYGYHAVPGLLSSVKIYNAKVRRNLSLSRRQIEGAYGQRTGCVMREIESYQNDVAPIVSESKAASMSSESLKKSMSAPATRSALASWSRCMKQSGYRYSDPLTASSDRTWARTKKANSEEKKTAVTDVLCQDKAHLIKTWSRDEGTIQNALIRKHKKYFNNLAASLSRQLKVAHAWTSHGDRKG